MTSTELEAFDNRCRLLDRFVSAAVGQPSIRRTYSAGTSEDAFGRWLERSGPRSDIVILDGGEHWNWNMSDNTLPAMHLSSGVRQ